MPIPCAKPPFCAFGSAVNLDATAVDEQFGGHAVYSGKLGEDAFPHAALGPASEAVVERLLRPVDMFGAVTPATTALQRMDNARQHTPVIGPRQAPRVRRNKRLDP